MKKFIILLISMTILLQSAFIVAAQTIDSAELDKDSIATASVMSTPTLDIASSYGLLNVWIPEMVKTIEEDIVLDGYFSDYDWIGGHWRSNNIVFNSKIGRTYFLTTQAKGNTTLIQLDMANGNAIDSASRNNDTIWGKLSLVMTGTGEDIGVLLQSVYITEDAGYFKGIKIYDITNTGNEGLAISELEEIYSTGDGSTIDVNIQILDSSVLHTVTFTISDQQGNPLENALVTIDQRTYITDSTGQIIVEDIIDAEHSYMVRLSGYQTLIDSFEVNGADKTIDITLAAAYSSGSYGLLNTWTQGMIKSVQDSFVIDGYFSDYDWTGGFWRSNHVVFSGEADHTYFLTAQVKGNTTLSQIDMTNGSTIDSVSRNNNISWGKLSYLITGDGHELGFLLRSVYITEDKGYFKGIKIYDITGTGNEGLSIGELEEIYPAGDGSAIDVEIEIPEQIPSLHNVAFVITDSQGKPLKNAVVTIGGNVYITNVNGQTTLQLANGAYDYSIALEGYDTVDGNLIINNQDLEMTVSLESTMMTIGHVVSVSVNPAAGGSVTGGGTYSEGASVTVTATANSGYNFSNWTEGGAEVNKNAAYTFKMSTAGRNLIANFAANPVYTVTFDSQGGSPTASINNISAGSTIIAPAAPVRPGYTFGGWYREPSCVNAWNFNTDTVIKNTTLYAKWTYNSGGGGGSSTSAPTPEPKPTARMLVSNDNISWSIIPKLDNSTGAALVEVDSASLTGAFEKSATNDKGVKTVVVDIPEIDGAKAYELALPAGFLTAGDASRLVEIKTGAASVTVPGNMIAAADAAGAQNVSLTIAAGDKSKLDAAVQAQIGHRPVIELNLKIDGKQVSWSNPNAPVTVTVPYTPAAEELKDPEHITVWYIDGSGKVVAVPNGRYDPATGKVTFAATHFSRYAVAYVHKTFGDLGGAAWARKPIEVMASKGIISGTGKDAFSPAANIIRADYLVLLVKTLGLTAEFDGNFDDAEPGAYYYEALGIAKKLGVASGGGNNCFSPKENISRQDMMVLTARALEKFKGLKAADNISVLDKFSDKGDIAGYAVNSLTTLDKEGLITGSGDRLNPRVNTTRAEAAVFLYRVYNKY